MVLNGTIGARLNVPFPVLNRSSFGFWFSYFSVISRVVLSMFWFGVQTFTGSECVYQMIKAIWPSIAHLPNHLPVSANITTSGTYPCRFVAPPFNLSRPQRPFVLLPLLAHPISVHVYLAPEDSMVVCGKGCHCSRCMDCHAHLVVRQGSASHGAL